MLTEVEQVTENCIVTVGLRNVTVNPLPGKSIAADETVVLPISFLGKISQIIGNLADAVDKLERDQTGVVTEVRKFVPLGNSKKKNLFIAGMTLGRNLANKDR